MELVSWSLNAIDSIFSKNKAASGDPWCPEDTFSAGYVLDSWGKWRPLCLSVLSVEDVEDVFLFGFMAIGFLLIGLGGCLIYRKINKSAAAQSTHKLLSMTNEMGKAVGSLTMGLCDLNRKMDSISVKVTALQADLNTLKTRLDCTERR